MLDLDHPQSEHIFAAAALEDAILTAAGRMVCAPAPERSKLLASCEEQFGAMRLLNADHFGASPFIASAIDDLQAAMRLLAETALTDMSVVLFPLERLRSNEGFGTWAI